MIRALWVVPRGTTWLGGQNYYRNLLRAINLLPEPNVQPVIWGAPKDLPYPLNGCQYINEPYIPSKFTAKGFLIRLKKYLFKEHEFYSTLHEANIDIISHCQFGKEICHKIPTIPWIPDFQQEYFPEFFSHEEIEQRRAINGEQVVIGKLIILSSEQAKKDFFRLYPDQKEKARVLRFVSPAPTEVNQEQAREILNFYKIKAIKY